MSSPQSSDWLRYERGDLPASEAERVERELVASPEGRARLELLRVLGASARSPRSFERVGDCPDEFELAEVAEGVAEASVVRRVHGHLETCGHCLLLIEGALEEVAVAESERVAEAGAPLAVEGEGATEARPLGGVLTLLTSRPMRFAAAAAVLLATGLLLFQRPNWQGSELAEMARIEALPVRIVRGETSDSPEGLRRAGLTLYAEGRYAEAGDMLQQALAAEPNGEAGLYLGSALLHQSRAADAIPVLRTALQRADEALAPEILWQLAQCALAVNDGRWAREVLLQLESSTSAHASAARELLVDLRKRER